MEGQSQQPPSGQASSSLRAGTICSQMPARVVVDNKDALIEEIQPINSKDFDYLASDLPFAS